MSTNRMINDINDSSEKLFDYFEKFKNNPESFNEFAGEQLAYISQYLGDQNIKYESALIFLRFKCNEIIGNINTCKLLVSNQIISGPLTEECLDIYDELIDSTIDQIVSLQLEVERILKTGGGIINSTANISLSKTAKKGRKPKDGSILEASHQAILFYYLADVEAIPGKNNKSEISRFFELITGSGNDHARKAMSFGLNTEEKKEITSKLQAAIKLINDH